MLAVLITLTPDRQNEFIDCQNAKVRIAILPIMDVTSWWNSTLELLGRGYQSQEFTCEWVNNRKCNDFRPLCTAQNECTIVNYVIEVLDPGDVETASSYSASCHYCLQWNVQLYRWHWASCSYEEISMNGKLILRREDHVTEAVKILCWSNSKDWYTSHFSTYPPSFTEVAII